MSIEGLVTCPGFVRESKVSFVPVRCVFLTLLLVSSTSIGLAEQNCPKMRSQESIATRRFSTRIQFGTMPRRQRSYSPSNSMPEEDVRSSKLIGCRRKKAKSSNEAVFTFDSIVTCPISCCFANAQEILTKGE